MLRKIIPYLLVLICIFGLNIAAHAAIDPYWYTSEAKGNTAELLTLTNPEMNEYISKVSINVSGKAEQGTTIVVMQYKEDKWIDLFDTTEHNSFEVNESEMFIKEFVLPGKGEYKIRVLALNGDKSWIVERTITLVDEGFKQVVIPEITVKLEDLLDKIVDKIKSLN